MLRFALFEQPHDRHHHQLEGFRVGELEVGDAGQEAASGGVSSSTWRASAASSREERVRK